MFEDILRYIPEIYVFWTGVLIAWSAMTTIGMGILIHKVEMLKFKTRHSDRVTMGVSFIGTLFLFLSMFIFSEQTAQVIDLALGINFWYTLFLSYVGWANLSGLPIVMALKTPRHDDPYRSIKLFTQFHREIKPRIVKH